jgi:hypothetical protein
MSIQDLSGVVTVHGCVPINRVVLIDAQAGRTMTRPWIFAINGEIDVPSFLNNGSITPNGMIDVRNVAMGYDGVLTLLDGTELAHIFRFHIYLDPITDQLQPIRSPRRLSRMTGFDATLEFEEYVLNDTILLQQVVPQMLSIGSSAATRGAGGPDGCEPWLDFQGVIENRICV